MLFIQTTASKEAIGTRHAAFLFHVQTASTSPTRVFTFGNNRAAKLHNTFHIKKFFSDYFSIIMKNLRLRFHFRLYNINWESTKRHATQAGQKPISSKRAGSCDNARRRRRKSRSAEMREKGNRGDGERAKKRWRENIEAATQGGISACAAPRRRRQKPLPRSANRHGATLVCVPRSRWQQWLPRAVRLPRCP